MPFNLLLLPLLSGFLFTRRWNATKYETLRAESERLLLLSSVWGIVFLAIAFAITSYARPRYLEKQFPKLKTKVEAARSQRARFHIW